MILQVTAATTQTMLLLTSSASSIVYAQLGDTPWDWATVMLPMAFVATLAGQVSTCKPGVGGSKRPVWPKQMLTTVNVLGCKVFGVVLGNSWQRLCSAGGGWQLVSAMLLVASLHHQWYQTVWSAARTAADGCACCVPTSNLNVSRRP